MAKEQADFRADLKSQIMNFCLHDMRNKGCAECVLNDLNICDLESPGINELKRAIEMICRKRGESITEKKL